MGELELAFHYIFYLIGYREVFYPQEEKAFYSLIFGIVGWCLFYLVLKSIIM